MAYELLPTRKDKVAIEAKRFVFECVNALKMKRLQTDALIGDPETLSELFDVIVIELGLQLKSKHPKEDLRRFWQQNRVELIPLIAEHMREGPLMYEAWLKSERTQKKDVRKTHKNGSLDADESKTATENLTERHNDMLAETKQKLCDMLTNTITRTELEATIQNLRTEFNNELERRQKVFEGLQLSTTKEIEFMAERSQKRSESTSDCDHHDDYELSPEPARAGKSHLIKRSKIWGTLDTELEYLLKKEAKRKGVTFSRILDSAIWNFLKNPPLSFQKIQQDDED